MFFRAPRFAPFLPVSPRFAPYLLLSPYPRVSHNFRPGISEQLWSVFPMLYRTWDKWAFDLISNMAVPIDNYISRGTDVFIAGSSAEGNR